MLGTAQTAGAQVRKTKPQVVAKVGVEREEGYLYFIDKDGDVSRAKMARAVTGAPQAEGPEFGGKEARASACGEGGGAQKGGQGEPPLSP